MFADITLKSALGGAITRSAHEARPRQVFKVASPRDAGAVEEVDNGRDVVWDVYWVVMVKAKVVAAYGGDIVGLGWVGLGVVFG